MSVCVCVHVCACLLAIFSVGGRLVVEGGHLEKREVEDGNSLEMVGLLCCCEGPWGLGGMVERGEVKAHETKQGHHRGRVRTGGHVNLQPLMTDQEVDAKTVVEEVWFWDKSLEKAREEWVLVAGGPSCHPLLRLQGAQVE